MPAVISPNFKVKAVDYGDLKFHSVNCSLAFDEQIIMNCEDGWVSIGRLEMFTSKVNSQNTGTDYDFSIKLQSAALHVHQFYNHTVFLDPTHNLLYVLQYITYQQDHFYKKGIYDLDEDNNRYDVLSKQTDYPHLINNYLS